MQNLRGLKTLVPRQSQTGPIYVQDPGHGDRYGHGGRSSEATGKQLLRGRRGQDVNTDQVLRLHWHTTFYFASEDGIPQGDVDLRSYRNRLGKAKSESRLRAVLDHASDTLRFAGPDWDRHLHLCKIRSPW
jgi:hypothetical protein